ncbi:MAG: hypothetical protein CMF96_07530 [Candidatus Marinimicrobia bacterium]|nr:hypothetical protein [Candidatus Neomarinimicrobiota bacterium]
MKPHQLDLNIENYKGKSATYSGGRGELFHDWFPYLEGFSSEFVIDIIRQRFNKPKSILEPFCGVGTTPITLLQQNISCGYCEVNPFLLELTSLKLSSLKLNKQDTEKLISDLSQLENQIKISLKKVEPNNELDTSYKDSFEDAEYISEPNKALILKLKTIENEIIREKLKPYFRIIVSTCLLKASLLRRAGDVRYKTKRELEKGVPNIINLVSEKIHLIQNDLAKLFNMSEYGDAFLVSEDAKELKNYRGKNFDGVITSPPYLNGTNYIRNTKLELWYLGYLKDKKDLRTYRNNVVTSAINDVTKESGASVVEEANDIVRELQSNCYDKRIPKMAAAYFEDMKLVAKGIHKDVNKNSPVCIDIGDSIYGGVHIPTHKILSDIFISSGFKTEDSVILRKRYSNKGHPLTQRLLFFRK